MLRVITTAMLVLLLTCFFLDASGVAPGAYNTIQDEGSNLARRSTLNFVGSGVACVDATTKTTCTVSGGVTSAYSTIQNEGTPLTQRSVLNMLGVSVDCADDAGNSRTNCTFTSGLTIGRGAFASRPGSGTATGDIYFTTDSPVSSYWNGSTWLTFGPIYQFTPFDGTGYAWTNQGGATGTATGGYWRFTYPTGAGENERVFTRAAASTDTITAAFSLDSQLFNSQHFGLCAQSTTTGDGLVLAQYYNDGNLVSSTRSTPSTAPVFGVIINQRNYSNLMWLRMTVDPTNVTMYASSDGQNFYLFATQSVGALVIDRIGFCGAAQNASNTFGANVFNVN